MAASTIPAPGTEYGPCVPRCQHKDCAELRRMAESTCRLCGWPIEYDRRYYRDPNDDANAYVHARCLERTTNG